MILSSLILLVFSPLAHAYPEMVRHHYVNCNSCHVNPNGGGLLNEYGRGMAGEVLSTWHYENESLFLHGAIKPEKMPKFLNIGGDVRGVQVHRETKKVREGRYILMQAMIEPGITVGPVTAVAAYGQPDVNNHINGGLSRFYLLGNATETIQVKAGRFLPAFGINDPHHILSTRGNLGFGYDSERTSVEAHYSGEQWHAALGGSESRMKSALRQEEQAVSGQLERFFADKYRVGASLWRGKSAIQRRWVLGMHSMLGFTEHLYFLGEADIQEKQPFTLNAPLERGFFHFGRLGYEITQGLHLVALEDIAQSNLDVVKTLVVQFGGAVLWYPRPHFELELALTQRKTLQQSPDFEDYAYLLFHYYL